MSSKVKVMLVDDSTIIRGLISRALTEAGTVEIVATAGKWFDGYSIREGLPAGSDYSRY